jgi:hypothetical protein
MQVVSNTIGLRTATEGAANTVVISESAFDYNDYGWNLAATSARTNNQNDFAGVTVSDTTFNYNKFKGLYAEKLHNATFTNVTANGSGYGTTSPNGINLNLKYGTFANIAFNGLTVTNSGNGANNSAGIAITPRNDSPSYSAKPASLSGLSLNNVTITGSPTTPSNIYYDLVLGNNIADSVRMSGVELQGTGIGLLVYGSAQGNPASFDLGNTRFASSLAGYVINAAGTATVTGASARYGDIAGGSSVTVDDGFSIADKIIDRTDASLYGNVIVRSGNVYMTPNSYLAPATQANVQTAVSGAAAGNTVWVKTGSYAAGTATASVNNLTIDVASGVTGFSGVILAESVTDGAITVTGASALDVTGNAGNNVLTGNSQTNTLTGGAGNDTLVGLAGTNSYNGGSGIDQIVYSGSAVSYTLALNGSTVTVNGPDGSDTLAGVETLQFADKRAVIVGNAVASEYTTVAQGMTAAESGDIMMVVSGTYSELIIVNKLPNEIVVGPNSEYTTIQSAINAADAGDTIQVMPGTYVENLTISKQLTIVGSGNGTNSTVDTIVTSATANTPVITLSAGGVSTTSRMTIKNMRITGATGLINEGAGILVQSASSIANITLADVAAVNNGGAGIAFNSTAAVADVVISGSTLSDNGNAGIRIASAVPSFTGLTVSNSTIANNMSIGFSYNPNGTVTNVGTDFTFTDVTFTTNNKANQSNQHDVSFFAFRGNATLTNVSVAANNTSAYAIAFTSNSSSYAPLGNVALTNVTVTGKVGKGAITFQNYSNVSGVRMSGVDVRNVIAPWGDIIIAATAGNTMNLGNTQLKSVVLWNVGGADATNAQFYTATGTALNRTVLADAFTTANQVVDGVDVAGLGLVRFVPNTMYVTTTSGSIQRGVDMASAGDTINVNAGTYTGTVTLAKSVKIVGAGINDTIVNGNGGNGFNITTDGVDASNRMSISNLKVMGAARGVNVSNNADFITIDQVNFTSNTSTGVSIDTSNTSDDVIVRNSTFSGNGLGIKIHSTGVASNMLVEGNTFTNNSGGGLYSGDASDSFAPISLSNFTLRNNTFTDNGSSNNLAGVYLERLTSGTIEGNTFANNGIASNPRAIIINLKHKSYSGITIARNQITENRSTDAATGYGISVAARDDASYASAPASLETVSITANEVSGFYYGLTIANNVNLNTVTASNNKVSNGVINIYATGSAAGTMTMRNNSITTASAYFIMNESMGTIDATNNWFGTPFVEFIEPALLGQIDYDPALVDGTDVSGDIGFQN